jgi:hypothetical protein
VNAVMALKSTRVTIDGTPNLSANPPSTPATTLRELRRQKRGVGRAGPCGCVTAQIAA